jgi:bifunctional non-homologous end joining protein LigD
MPEFVEPQLATLVERPPEGPEWVHEIKFDGYRVLCRIEGPRVTLTTRHGKDWTASFPTLVGAAQGLRVRDAILDGEIVVLDERGVSSFQALQNALGHGREKEIVYQAFDLISLDGVDLRTRPLVERKEALARVLEKAPATIRYTDHIEGRGGAFFEKSCEFALEGIVSKLRDAPYRSGRSWAARSSSSPDTPIPRARAPGSARSSSGSTTRTGRSATPGASGPGSPTGPSRTSPSG